MHFSIIVLSDTKNESVFRMNLDCFNSFIESTKNVVVNYEIILVESNKNSKWKYNLENLKVITPKGEFNFHKFLNIGIKNTLADYYILSNNDVVYDINWLKELLKVSEKNKEILSFSPFDNLSNKLPKEIIENNEQVIGYDIQKHLTGWCLIIRSKLIGLIKEFDERFDFYYADFDYAMQLRKFNVKHTLVTKSKVHHLESMSSKSLNKKESLLKIDERLPKYIIKENWFWVLENQKMIEGVIRFHDKWGSRKVLKVKVVLTDYMSKMGFGYFNRYIL